MVKLFTVFASICAASSVSLVFILLLQTTQLQRQPVHDNGKVTYYGPTANKGSRP